MKRQEIDYLIDIKLREKRVRLWNYLWQSALATIVVFILLLTLNIYTQTLVIAALGSTVFTLFAMPERVTAMPRNSIGGHVVCIMVGGLCHVLNGIGPLFGLLSMQQYSLFMISLAIGLSTFVMVVTDTEHPPAAGTALYFVLNGWNTPIAVFMVVLVVLLAIIKRAIRPWMKDLI